MADVKILPTKVERSPIPEVVNILEQLLEKAKTGHLRAIAFSYVRPGYHSSYGYSGAHDRQALNALHSGLMTAWTAMGVEMDQLASDVDRDGPARD